MNRWTSRKFLTTLAAQLAAIAMLLFPAHEHAIADAAQSITALMVLLLSARGYVTAEASIDREHKDGDEPAVGRASRPSSAEGR